MIIFCSSGLLGCSLVLLRFIRFPNEGVFRSFSPKKLGKQEFGICNFEKNVAKTRKYNWRSKQRS